jgi:hypothetical protein
LAERHRQWGGEPATPEDFKIASFAATAHSQEHLAGTCLHPSSAEPGHRAAFKVNHETVLVEQKSLSSNGMSGMPPTKGSPQTSLS